MKKAIWVIPVILVIVIIVATLICFRLNKENDSSNNDSHINETLDDKSKNLNGNNIVQSNNVMRDILDNPAIFATMIVAVIPVLVLYACFQKKIIENTNAGGLKG